MYLALGVFLAQKHLRSLLWIGGAEDCLKISQKTQQKILTPSEKKRMVTSFSNYCRPEPYQWKQHLFLLAGSVVFWQSGLHAKICSWQKKHQYIVRGNFLNTDRYLTQFQLHEKSWFWKGGSTTPSGFTKKIAISSCKNIILGHWAGSERNNIRTWSKYFSFLSCEKQVLDLTDKQCQ